MNAVYSLPVWSATSSRPEPASAGERLEVGAVLAAVASRARGGGPAAGAESRCPSRASSSRTTAAGGSPPRRRARAASAASGRPRGSRRRGAARARGRAAHARVRLGSELGAELDAEGGAAERGEPREAQGARDWTLTPARSRRLAHGACHAERVRIVAVQAQGVGCDRELCAVDRPHDAVAGEAHRCLRRGLRVAHDCARPRAGDEPPGAVVGAIDEGLGRIAQAAGKSGALHRLRPGEADEHEPATRARGAARDRRGELGVVRGLVVERAVRLHVAQRRAVGRGEREQARPPGRARRPRPRRAPP
jgi:hypothetical protein